MSHTNTLPELSDPAELATQYGDGNRLRARLRLHERFGRNPHSWMRWIFDTMRQHLDQDGADVLELGCGVGSLWRDNGTRIPKGWTVMLSDASPGMLAEAEASLASCGRSFEFACMDAMSIPCGDGSFDAVIANHLLYHLPDIDKALAEVIRVLRPGGRLIASTVGRAHLHELFAMASRCEPAARPWEALDGSSFVLESGEATLRRLFPHVALYRYDDELAVTEAQAVSDYICSLRAEPVLTGPGLERFVAMVEHEIAANGAFHMTKAMGLFVARRA